MAIERSQISQDLADILNEMIEDWGVELDEPIGDSTTLVGDLEFSSIDIIHLVMAIEDHFEHPKMGFNDLLMEDGKYVQDLEVGKVVDFIGSKIKG